MSQQPEDKTTRVLIFPAGSESALDMYDSLRYREGFEVFGLTANRDFSEFRFDADHYLCAPYYINEPDFDEKFDELLQRWGIDVVIPTHDAIVEYLAGKRDAYCARILVSDAHTAQVCRRKRSMYEEFAGEDYCPAMHASIAEIPDEAFPVFAKPDVSAASVGAFLAKSREDLAQITDEASYVICEYLPGDELTIDCFTDAKGRLAFTGARRTERMRMGLPFRSVSVPMTDELRGIVVSMNDKLGFLGSWFVDLKQDAQGKFKLMEVNCRQAGTLTLYRHMGISFALEGIRALMGEDVSLRTCVDAGQVERCVHNSFHLDAPYERAFLDADALLVGSKACVPVVGFAYQCINRGIPVTLVASEDERSGLSACRVSLDIFDDVAHALPGLAGERALYVCSDDAKRAAALDAGYLVFEPATIDALMEE